MRSRERDQLLDGRCVKRRVNDKHIGRGGGKRHGREIAHRIEGHAREKARVDRERSRGAHQHRVAVGRRLRDDIGADVAAGARPVVDHHLLREAVAQFLRDRAGDDVGAAARRKRDDEADGLRGIGVRRGPRLRRQCCKRCRERQSGTAAHHFLFFFAVFLSPCLAKYSRAVLNPPSAAGYPQ